MGSFPIAQLRDPYSAVRYLAERMDLIGLLRIQHPDGDDEWSAADICDGMVSYFLNLLNLFTFMINMFSSLLICFIILGWAKLKGFYTARAARPDAYRAANHLLRLALDGKICLCLRPLGYAAKKGFFFI